MRLIRSIEGYLRLPVSVGMLVVARRLGENSNVGAEMRVGEVTALPAERCESRRLLEVLLQTGGDAWWGSTIAVPFWAFAGPWGDFPIDDWLQHRMWHPAGRDHAESMLSEPQKQDRSPNIYAPLSVMYVGAQVGVNLRLFEPLVGLPDNPSSHSEWLQGYVAGFPGGDTILVATRHEGREYVVACESGGRGELNYYPELSLRTLL